MEPWDAQLEQDLDWRTAELGSLKVQISSTEKGSLRRKALLRASWAILYAHYEGFCKFAHDLYLDAIRRSKSKIKDCSKDITLLALRKPLNKAKTNYSDEKLLDFFREDLESLMEAEIEFDEGVNDTSNLWPKTLRKMTKRVGLQCKTLDNFDNKIGKLVGLRNDIAHGDKMTISSLKELREYENAALTVMHEVALEVLDAIEQQRYLAQEYTD